jgi:hypothetical protein
MCSRGEAAPACENIPSSHFGLKILSQDIDTRINAQSRPASMRFYFTLVTFFTLAPLGAHAQVAAARLTASQDFHINWEVKNRFRLFRNEADFLQQVAVSRGDGVLAAEQRLAKETDGYGWAKDVVGHLCVDLSGDLIETCERDGIRENYLVPQDHRIGVKLAGPIPPGAVCDWTFQDDEKPINRSSAPCDREIDLRVTYGRTTDATVDIALSDGTTQRVGTEIAVRDILIAGMGDSVAAGEGNPDRAIALEGGFCFRRLLVGQTTQYFRPSRAGFAGDRSCAAGPNTAAARDWARHGARWMSPGCHRSLYGYQVRTALALAIEQPHIAVTLIPLACTGAQIEKGMFNSQLTDDCPWVVGIDTCSGVSPPQLDELKDILAKVRRQRPQRTLDLMLLTTGANDVSFATLLANVIVDSPRERFVFKEGGALASVEVSQKELDDTLPKDFARLRAALKPLMGGDLSRVVFVSYGNPAMQSATQACQGTRDGFDVHPGFAADGARLHAVAEFVETKFLPKLKILATCEGNQTCRDPRTERMVFVDSHQGAFDRHGFCVRAPGDPKFDRACFSTTGDSFVTNLTTAADDPMACALPASDYRPYASRARWIRTVNDSYFTAMTYPVGMPAMLKPSDIHDAVWGVLSAVFGGALHPTAEGYAAMADAALPAVRQILGLSAMP